MNRLRLLGQLGAKAVKQVQPTRGGGGGWPGGSFWSEGTQSGHNGFMFGEVPPAPGQARKVQWWEPIWYLGYGGFFAGVYMIYHAKPLEALDIKYWARPRAEEELKLEQRMMDKLSQRPDLKQRLVEVAAQLNMIEDEVYDLILMRNEYKVKLGLHTGRVPADLNDIYAELAAE